MKRTVLFLAACFIITILPITATAQEPSGAEQTVYDNDTCEHTSEHAVNSISPTCTGDGYTLYQCDACGMKHKKDFVPSFEHDYAVIDSLSADLYCYMECSRCGLHYLTNDLNGDNSVDIKDMVRLKKYIAGLPVDISLQKGDIDFSGGYPDSADAIALKKLLLGLVKASDFM